MDNDRRRAYLRKYGGVKQDTGMSQEAAVAVVTESAGDVVMPAPAFDNVGPGEADVFMRRVIAAACRNTKLRTLTCVTRGCCCCRLTR